MKTNLKLHVPAHCTVRGLDDAVAFVLHMKNKCQTGVMGEIVLATFHLTKSLKFKYLAGTVSKAQMQLGM